MGLIQSSGKQQTDAFTGGASAVTYNAASNFTVGNTVVITINHFANGAARITGITVAGATAVKDKDQGDSTPQNYTEIWHAEVTAAGTAVVISTGAGGGQYITCGFEEWDNIAETPVDQTGSTGQTTNAAPSATTAATNTPDQLVYAGFCDYVGTNWTSATPPSGYTETWEEFNGTAHQAGSGAYKVVSATGAQTATFATGASMSWIADIVTYKLALGGRGLGLDFMFTSNTQVNASAFNSTTGSIILVGVGRGVLNDHDTATVSDNKGNGSYTQLGVKHAYTNWATSGTALFVKTNAAGGTGHVVHATKPTNNDEVTVIAAEFPGVNTVVDQQWNEVTPGPTTTSANVTTTGAGILCAFWWGDNVNGELLPAVPSDWTLLKHTSSLAGNHVQGAVAFKRVTAAGTYSITWTPSTSQGAQMWIVAMQQVSGGPSITSQPTTQYGPVGGSVTFTIGATSSGGTLHYQWKDDGVNVGTDSNTYTKSSLAAADSGSSITCDVTDDNGTVVSSTVKLWVTLPVPIGMFDPMMRSSVWFDELFA